MTGKLLHMKNQLANTGLILVSLVCGLLFVELGLHLLEMGALYKSGISRIADPVLKYRLPPHLFPEIDSKGFRNNPEKGPFDVVILGDSHAYGYGVEAQQNFPEQFSKLTGLSSYNYGMGGYGPAQYAFLSGSALEKKPKTLVVTMFMGNDLLDACEVANEQAYWKNYFDENGLSSELCGNRLLPFGQDAKPEGQGISRQMKAFVKGTRVGSLVNHHLWLPLRGWWQLHVQARNDETVLPVDDKVVTSLFRVWPNHTPKAKEGLKITRHMLLRILATSRQMNIRVVLLVLPSKQNVYFEYLLAAGYRLPQYFAASVKAERAYSASLISFVTKHGATGISAFEHLASLVEQRLSIYPVDDDSHPIGIGYLQYAKTLASVLQH
jgi:hypothetical protein